MAEYDICFGYDIVFNRFFMIIFQSRKVQDELLILYNQALKIMKDNTLMIQF